VSKTVKVLVILAFVVVMGYVVVSSFQLGKVSCEVCIEFKGRRACRTARGPTANEAIATAASNACALIAQGRTDSILCGNTQPASVQCSE
jgi:hypothetical protein